MAAQSTTAAARRLWDHRRLSFHRSQATRTPIRFWRPRNDPRPQGGTASVSIESMKKESRLQGNANKRLRSSTNRGHNSMNNKTTPHGSLLLIERENYDEPGSPRRQTSIQDFFCAKAKAGAGQNPKPESRGFSNSSNKAGWVLTNIDPNQHSNSCSPPADVIATAPSSALSKDSGGEAEGHRANCPPPVVVACDDSPRNSEPSRPRARRRKLEQLYLDLGQRDFARPVVCETCGMLHVHGVEEDHRDHLRLCEIHTLGVPFRSERRVVGRPRPDSTIHLIRPGDPLALRRRAEQVRAIVDRELGSAPPSSAEGGASQSSTYLYARGGRVVGLCDAEPQRRGRVLRWEEDGTRTTTAGESRPAAVGIRRLWVHPLHRRTGVATALVEAVRRTAAFGSVLPASAVAFSSPTEAGARFALGYVRRFAAPGAAPVDVLVYN